MPRVFSFIDKMKASDGSDCKYYSRILQNTGCSEVDSSMTDEWEKYRNLKPSPRKSIHYNKVSREVSMGRYGTRSSQPQMTTSTPKQRFYFTDDEAGVDETDDAVHSQNEPPSRLHKRRYSCDKSLSSENSEIENDIAVLSKSLPKYLPSTYCSERLDSSVRRNTSTNNESRHRSRSRNSVNISKTESIKKESASNKSNIILLCSAVFSVLAILYPMYNVLFGLAKNFDNRGDEMKFYDDIKEIGITYKINEDAILRIQTGIQTIGKREDTGCFVFIYDSEGNSHILEEVREFIHSVATVSARFLRNETYDHSDPYVKLSSRNLDVNTDGQLLDKYKDRVQRQGVMLVEEIDKIPNKLANAFHYYCDEDNPLVPKSAIFFTLDMSNCGENQDQRSETAQVEKCLLSKWRQLHRDKIGPLLTRVVNVVINIVEDFLQKTAKVN